MKKILTLLFCFTIVYGYSQNQNNKKKKSHKTIISRGNSNTSRNDSTRIDHDSAIGDIEVKSSQKKRVLNNKKAIRKLKATSLGQRNTKIKNKPLHKSIRDAGKTIGAGNPSKITAKKVIKFKAGLAQSNNANRTILHRVRLINRYPKNNTIFNSINDINEFTWQLIGNHAQKPRYKIELTKIEPGTNKEIVNSAITETNRISAKKEAKFKAGKALETTVNRTTNINNGFCKFKWRVIETQTGISSSYFYFKIKNCNNKASTSSFRKGGFFRQKHDSQN